MAFLDSKPPMRFGLGAETLSSRDRYLSKDSLHLNSNPRVSEDTRSKRLSSECGSYNQGQEDVASTAAQGYKTSQGFSFGPRERFSSIQIGDNGSGITAAKPYILMHKKAGQRMSMGKSNFLAPSRLATLENTIDGTEAGGEGTVHSQLQNHLYSFINRNVPISGFNGQSKPATKHPLEYVQDQTQGSPALKSSEIAKDSTAVNSNTGFGESSPKFSSPNMSLVRQTHQFEVSQFAQRQTKHALLHLRSPTMTNTLESVPSEGICKKIKMFFGDQKAFHGTAELKDDDESPASTPCKLPRGLCIEKLRGDEDEVSSDVSEIEKKPRPTRLVLKSQKGFSLHRLDSRESRTFNDANDGSPSHYALLNPFKVFRLKITDQKTPTQDFTSNLNLTRKITNKTQTRDVIRFARTNFRDPQFINTSSTPPMSIDKPVRSERFLDKGSNTSIDKNLGKVPSFNFRSGGRRTSAIKSKYSAGGAGAEGGGPEDRNTFSDYRAESHQTPHGVSASNLARSRVPVLDSNIDIVKLLSKNEPFMSRFIHG